MYNPCFECKNRYGKEYSEECDETCEYAKIMAKLKPWGTVDEIVNFLEEYEEYDEKDATNNLTNDDIVLLKMMFNSIEGTLRAQLAYDKCSVEFYNALFDLREKLGLKDIV